MIKTFLRKPQVSFFNVELSPLPVDIEYVVLSIWQVPSPGLTKTDLGLAILLYC